MNHHNKILYMGGGFAIFLILLGFMEYTMGEERQVMMNLVLGALAIFGICVGASARSELNDMRKTSLQNGKGEQN